MSGKCPKCSDEGEEIVETTREDRVKARDKQRALNGALIAVKFEHQDDAEMKAFDKELTALQEELASKREEMQKATTKVREEEARINNYLLQFVSDKLKD